MVFNPTKNPFKEKKEQKDENESYKNFDKMEDARKNFLSDINKHVTEINKEEKSVEPSKLVESVKTIPDEPVPIKKVDDVIEKKEGKKKLKFRYNSGVSKPSDTPISSAFAPEKKEEKEEVFSKSFPFLHKHVDKKPDNKYAKINVTEAKEGINWTRAGLYLSALAMVGIVLFSQMAISYNPALFVLIWVFGMTCFLPLGFIGGWLLLDSYQRCKIMRRFRGKNYGIVNFLHKGSQRIVTRIKNLDDDIIIQDGRLWYLNKEGIFYLNKDNQLQLHHKIDAEHIKTLPANVPCLFLDPETMLPLSFKEEKSKTNPQQAGAVILGYINNQIRKNASMRKSNIIFYVIIIAVVIVNLVIGIQLYQWADELNKTIPSLQHQVNRLIDIISNLVPPATTP